MTQDLLFKAMLLWQTVEASGCSEIINTRGQGYDNKRIRSRN